jgi:outer membrane protein assembly factor BamD
LKIAAMHYRQMEKPDRDFAEAAHAAEEYKVLIQQYPDSPLVPQAKQKLREVQEVLAERQFRIAHFYFLRDNLAASQARLESLIDSYPLYSGVDESLFELGMLYEKEAESIKKQKLTDAQKEKLVAQFQKKAIEAYSKIIARYPATDRVPDAKRRLTALNAPIPEPTAEALAESKAEEASRSKPGMLDRVTLNFKKHPSVLAASKVGEPNLNDETVKSAPALVNDFTHEINMVTLGQPTAGTGTPAPNEAAPTSQNQKKADASTDGAPPTPAPPQVNEVQKPTGEGVDVTQAPGTGSTQAQKVDTKEESSSKKKSKKGLRKLIPF